MCGGIASIEFTVINEVQQTATSRSTCASIQFEQNPNVRDRGLKNIIIYENPDRFFLATQPDSSICRKYVAETSFSRKEK